MNRFRVLEVLRARQGEWLSARDLARHLGASASEVERAAEDLRHMGYLVESQAEKGLRFAGIEDRLLAYEIVRDLGSRVIGRNVLCLEAAGSTNDVAWERARLGAPEGLTVLAEHQTQGRGRLGRRWESPPRTGLLMSVILKPGLAPERVSALTIVGAVGVTEALQESLHVPALIRWPNDIVLRGRKLGGILVEARKTEANTDFVLGIGLNVNLAEDDMPAELRPAATSLQMELGRKADRIGVARAVLRALDRWYGELRAGHYHFISGHWRQYSATLGGRITILENGRRYTGRVLDMSLEDGLILRLDSGVTRVFDGAQVSVVKET